jgi:hypothetical protein
MREENPGNSIQNINTDEYLVYNIISGIIVRPYKFITFFKFSSPDEK